MSCERFESLIALEAGGDLDAGGDARRLAGHLRDCAACRGFAAGMRDTRRALASLAEAPIGEEALAAVRGGVMRDVVSRAERRTRARRALALAAALTLSIGALLMLRASRPAPPQHAAEAIEPPAPPGAEPVATETSPATPVAPASRSKPPSPVASSPVISAPVTSAPATRGLVPEPPAVAATAPSVAEAAAEKIAEAAPGVATPPPTAASHAAQPLLVKLVSEDADLVIYWLVQPTEEKQDELSTV